MQKTTSMPVALTIAGSDSGGGAGVQADILSFAANGVYAASAITCLTAQNPAGVSGLFPASPDFVLEQARQVARFFKLGAIKTGMLLNAEIIGAVAEFVDEHKEVPFVLDPVMVATSGARLLEESAIEALQTKLFPKATLITPNLDEAAILLGHRPADEPNAMIVDAQALARKLGRPLLLKGGHAGTPILQDVLAVPDGTVHVFKAPRCEDTDTHGSGCTLASAIAAHLALGRSLSNAVEAAHAYLQEGMVAPVTVGERHYIAHLVDRVKVS
ncbi:MAG: bifunctional hydroxymethylpyrimidine kinase/phosphomethylpyrimidine kinase [Puniceicoccales bacterium]|nr:bifunctional hydroxymethylpyrimidine kinase/phosphomethylpyrimidine kinase [Puniceicoccales bacterium]